MINQDIYIDVDNSFNLIINGNKKANFNELFDTYKETFVNNDSLNKYNNDTFQSAVNCGDTIKDKVNQVTINQLGLFQPFELQFTKDRLKDFIRLVKEMGIQKGISKKKPITRNKESVDSTITKQYITTPHDIAYDAGKNVTPFFVNPKDVQFFESIGKYLDPCPIRDSNFIFPQKNNTINISQNVFKRLGYDDNCSLNASANSPDNYNYEINIYGKNIIKNDKKDRKSDRNISQIFIGNKQKNELITKSKTKKEDKIALIIGKGWGDKLQVFIAFIYKLLNKDIKTKTIAVSTCDAVVYNLCCYFGITCFLFTSEKNKKNVKIKEILHYEPEMIDTTQFIKSLKKKFNKEKKKILEGYVAFLSLIEKIKNKNNQEITTGGTDNTYTFKKEFYECIMDDLNGIKEKIKNLMVDEQTTIDSLNKSYEDLIQYGVNYFIKEMTPGIFKITCTSANYNLTKITTGSGKPCFEKYGKIKKNHSFFNIGKKYFLEHEKKVGGTTPLENPPLENHLLKDSDYIYFMNDYNEDGTQKNFKVITKTSLLNQTLDDEKDEIEFDAIENLFKELKDLFNDYFDKDKYYFYDYWSEMMLRLDSEPDYSTDTLIKYSKEILEEFKDNIDVFEEITVKKRKWSNDSKVDILMKLTHPKVPKVHISNKPTWERFNSMGGKRRRKSAKIYKKPKIYTKNTTKKHK